MASSGGYTREENWPPGLYRRGGPTYWSKVYQNGRPVGASCKTPDYATACKVPKRRQVEAERGEMMLPVQERVRWEEVASDLTAHYEAHRGRDVKEAGVRLKHLDYFKGWKVAQITESAITGYVVRRKGKGAAPGTINRELSTLSKALRLAYRHRKLARVPHVEKLAEAGPRQGFFERSDFEAVVNHLPEYLRDFSRFAYLTGWRKGEITSLTWADVDRDAGAIRLRPENSKNGRGRVVVLEGDLQALMARRWDARLLEGSEGPRVVERVFHRDGEPVGDFRKAWATACESAGVPDRLFHDLRRTAVRNMIRVGVSETVAMRISGHRTRSVFDRYNVTSEEDLRTAAQRVDRYVDTLPRSRAVTHSVTTAQPSKYPTA